MFRINLTKSIATAAVIAGVLAGAGPASASDTPLQNTMVSGAVQTPGGQGKFGNTPRLAGGDMVAGFKTLSGMDSETEFMDYTDDSLLD
jgi:hypothetical protein